MVFQTRDFFACLVLRNLKIFAYFGSHHFMIAQSKTPGNKVHSETRILRRVRDNAMYSYVDILVFASEKLPYIIIHVLRNQNLCQRSYSLQRPKAFV